MSGQPSFTLDGSTLLTIGAVIGSLAGTIGFLFRALIAAKDARIAALENELVAQRQVLLQQIETLRADRDRFRDAVLAARAERTRPADR